VANHEKALALESAPPPRRVPRFLSHTPIPQNTPGGQMRSNEKANPGMKIRREGWPRGGSSTPHILRAHTKHTLRAHRPLPTSTPGDDVQARNGDVACAEKEEEIAARLMIAVAMAVPMLMAGIAARKTWRVGDGQE
jgi:hypothetical protein